MTKKNYKDLLPDIRRLAIESGDITLKYFQNDMGEREKNDGSPVTLADEEAEAYILAELEKLTPDIPIVAEELVASGILPEIDENGPFWLVDPLDGTKEFIKGSGEYTVNIALVYNRKPVIGVVFVPPSGQLFIGAGPEQATTWNRATQEEQAVHVRDVPDEGLTIVQSISHGSVEKMDAFLDGKKVAHRIGKGSSLKLCVIGSGQADLYPRFGPTCEWDIAAGHAFLAAAGGDVVCEDGSPFRYGKRSDKFLNPNFIATSSHDIL